MLLEIKNLSVTVKSSGLNAVNGISLSVDTGRSLLILGQSGSGKTMICRAMFGLTNSADFDVLGQIIFDETDILSADAKKRRKLYGSDIALIPQNPMTAFDPSYKLGHQLAETYRLHNKSSGKEAKAAVLEAMRRAGLEHRFAVLETCYAGDIAACVGLKNTTTGDTLCDPKHPVILESMEFPEPVIQLAIEPKTKAGQEKMGIGLAKLAEEDPTFRTWTDEETGQTIIAGMGELHLDIIVDRLLREFKVEANVGAPQVAYKETIKNLADVDHKYARQSGGKGQYGHVKIKVEPNESGKGYEFVNAVVGGAIPKEYIPAVDKGIQGAMKAGVLAGYQVVDVKVTLYEGSYHEVDSSEMAFSIAGSMAFKEAMKKADPCILEPIMKVSVFVPEDFMGTVIGDLNSRRGQILGQEINNGTAQVDALVPLSEMFGYSNDLRSKTQGRGNYTMEPDSYTEVPRSVAEKIMSARNKANG